MFNPSNDIQGKWEIANMDDAHFYRMGTWAGKPQVGFLGRILQRSKKLFGLLEHRPISGNQRPIQTNDRRPSVS